MTIFPRVIAALRALGAGGPTSPLSIASPSCSTADATHLDVDREHVLVVDDEALIADSVAAILERHGYHAVARYNGATAIEYLERRQPDILVSDLILPDLDGVRLGMAARILSPATRVVLFSGHGAAAADLLELASSDGYSFELLSKPVHPAQLLRALRSA